MSGRYKIVQYVPNPFLGNRFAVGAFVETSNGFSVEVAKRLPTAASLGGKREYAALKMILNSLSRSETFAALPETVGPYALLSEAREVPSGVADVNAWVSRQLGGTRIREKRPPSRQAAGTRFFEEYGLLDCVRSNFMPTESLAWSDRLGMAAPLGKISHWVEGGDQLWLLEPIVVAERQLEKEVPAVAKLLGSYKMLTKQFGLAEDVSLVAYMLGQGNEELRKKTMDELSPFATRVVDTSKDQPCEQFVASLRNVAGVPAYS